MHLFREASSTGFFGTCRGWWQDWRSRSKGSSKGRRSPLLPSLPSTAPARQQETAGRHWVVGKAKQDPHLGKGRSWSSDTAGDGISAGHGWGLTLPFGLLHAAVSPWTAASPPSPLGGGLGCSSHLHAFQSPFLEPFQIVRRCYRALHRWETTALDGEVLLSQKGGDLLGLQQILLLGFAAVSLLPSPAVSEHLRGS